MNTCHICPRNCNVNRPLIADNLQSCGTCGVGTMPVVARAAIHEWEEPCISGTKGSGTVFFSGCNLQCCYCQNYQISTERFGKPITIERLKAIYCELEQQGAHNINLVNPTHFSDSILASIPDKRLIPFVYNSSGYDSVETLRRFNGKIDIYMPDFKYSDDLLAKKYSHVNDYFDIATAAIMQMFRQTGPFRIDQSGILQSGLIVRHLVLPSHIENTLKIIDWIAEHFSPNDILFSLMFQYTPCGTASDFSEINRRISTEEYRTVSNYLYQTKIENGYIQELDSSDFNYIPDFDLTGIH